MKRIVFALFVALLGIVMLAGPSGAHDATVHGQAVCDGNSVTVTWTVHNDFNLTTVLSNATRVASQVNGKTLGKVGSPSATLTATETVPANGATLTLTVHAKWSDGFNKDDSATVKVPNNCVVNDATADVTTTPPSCTATGTAVVTNLNHASLVGSLDQTVGTHTAHFVSDAGHAFAPNVTTRNVGYTILDKISADDNACAVADASADVSVVPSTCSTDGTAVVGTLVNATLVGVLDTTPGTHTATFAADFGHRFANGTRSLDVTYTVTAKTGDCHTAALKVKTFTGCAKARRSLQVVKRHNVASVGITHNAAKTRWVVRATTKAGTLMHARSNGTGPWVNHVKWVFHTRVPHDCSPHPHGS